MLFRWPRKAELYFTSKATHGVCKARRFSLPAVGSPLERTERAFETLAAMAPTVVCAWFSGAMVEFGVLQAIEGKPRRKDLEALATRQLRDQGVVGEVALAISSADLKGRRLWAAVPSDWIHALRITAARAKLQLGAAAPMLAALTAKSDRGSKQLQRLQAVVVEEDSVIALPSSDFASTIDSSAYDSESDLEVTLDRIVLRAGEEVDFKFLTIYPTRTLSPLADRGWKTDDSWRVPDLWRPEEISVADDPQ